MRILMLNYEYPPLGGGASNATYYLLNELSQFDDITIDLITSSATNEFEEEKISGSVHIYKLPVGKKNLHYWTQKEIISYSRQAYKHIKKMKEQTQYDLIHAFFGIPCGAIAYSFRKESPYIVSLRGSDVPGFNERFSFQYIFLKPLIRRVWRNAAAVIANSGGLKELALETDRAAKIGIIYNGVNIEDFAQRDNRENEHIVILTVARLIKRKGIDDLIRAVPAIVKGHQNIKVKIIGEGNMGAELKALAEKLKVSEYIEFLGYVPHNEISNYYSTSDVFVLPSRNEGMSNTVLEAMASGLPVITTDTGGTRELIDGNGIIVPIEDSDVISEAVLRLINDHKLRVSRGMKSRKIAENMSWKKVADAYYNFYKGIK